MFTFSLNTVKTKLDLWMILLWPTLTLPPNSQTPFCALSFANLRFVGVLVPNLFFPLDLAT